MALAPGYRDGGGQNLDRSPLRACRTRPVVPANTASWRALQNAGLRRIGEGPMTDNPIDDPLHYIYRIYRPA